MQEVYFIDSIINSFMNYLSKVWDWFSGKKTTFAMIILFVYGGLSFVGVELPFLRDIGMWLGAVGLAHKAVKLVK